MAGWSRQCVPSLRRAVVDRRSRCLPFVGDVQPPSWPMTTPFANGARHGRARSLPGGCRKRVHELELLGLARSSAGRLGARLDVHLP